MGPLIKRNQGATIINFKDCVNSLFLSSYRKLTFCICCILCTCYPILHPLSSRSDVQKVCKNVQSQNQPLKTGIGFLCKALKTGWFDSKTASSISPVSAKHQMYINNYDSWQGFGQSNSYRFIEPSESIHPIPDSFSERICRAFLFGIKEVLLFTSKLDTI